MGSFDGRESAPGITNLKCGLSFAAWESVMRAASACFKA